MHIKKIKNKNLIYILLLFFLTIHFNLFENVYVIFKSNYETRLISNYGYCEKSSYGFIKYIDEKYKLKKNINILNDEVHPSSDAFIYKPKKPYYKDLLILLNYNDQESKININNYFIIDKFKNCFYLKKND